MTVEINRYKEGLRSEIIKLLSRGDSKKIPQKTSLWNWQYHESPYSKGTKNTGLVVCENGETVGFNGLMPVLLQYNGKTIDGAWSCDTIIDKKCRGKGYGGVLANAIKAEFPLVLGLGIGQLQSELMLRRGYQENQEIDRFRYTNKIYNLKDFVKKAFQKLKVVSNYYQRSSALKLSARIVDCSEIPTQVDDIWHDNASGFTKAVVRNHAYLKWRYSEHPFLRYQAIIIERENTMTALGVFLINDQGEAKLLDYVGPAINFQIKYLIAKTFKMKCSTSKKIECITTDTEMKKSLHILGFTVNRVKPRLYVYSNQEHDLHPEQNWFVMGGDSDQGLRR